MKERCLEKCLLDQCADEERPAAVDASLRVIFLSLSPFLWLCPFLFLSVSPCRWIVRYACLGLLKRRFYRVCVISKDLYRMMAVILTFESMAEVGIEKVAGEWVSKGK